jgi:hypothetical protein
MKKFVKNPSCPLLGVEVVKLCGVFRKITVFVYYIGILEVKYFAQGRNPLERLLPHPLCQIHLEGLPYNLYCEE